MSLFEKFPEWRNKGVEPPEELRLTGFAPGYKPPAAYFNWFWNKVIECINKLCDAADTKTVIFKAPNILATGWELESESGLYRYDLTLSDITQLDVVDINLGIPSLKVAEKCGLKPVTLTHDGGVYLYAESVPERAMMGTVVILKKQGEVK